MAENSVVSEGKSGEVGKMDSFPEGLVMKRNVRDAAYQVLW